MIQAIKIGEKIKGYTIQEVFEPGGFGVTYKAWDDAMDRLVAVKEFFPVELVVRGPDGKKVYSRDPEHSSGFRYGLKRFKEEAQTLARFDHPSIVKVYDFFEDNGTAYIIMQYADGRSLGELIESGGPISESLIKKYFFSIFDGLSEVHRAGLLHRDIKPENIYIRESGRSLLIDFGSARQDVGQYSRSITGIVSQGYAPTEQYGSDAKKQGPWTDIYAIGASIYKSISGDTPVDAPTRRDELHDEGYDPLPPAATIGKGHYSDSFLHAIDQCLSLSAKQRPQDVMELRDLFEGEKRRTLDGQDTTRFVSNEEADFNEVTALTQILSEQESQFHSINSIEKSRFEKPIFIIALLLILVGAVYGGYYFKSGVLGGEEPIVAVYSAVAGSEFDKPDDEGVVEAAETVDLNSQLKDEGGDTEGAVNREEILRIDEEKRRLAEEKRKRVEETERLQREEKEAARREALNYYKLAKDHSDKGSIEEIEKLRARSNARDSEATTSAQWTALLNNAENIQHQRLTGDFVWIPSGTFIMGDNNKGVLKSGIFGVLANNLPARDVSVEKFALGATEVKWSQYQICIDEGGCPSNDNDGGANGWGKGDRPVIEVSYEDITKYYLPWLNKKTSRTYRLPTEAEWEYAARANTRTKYPWGNDIGSNNAVCRGCGSEFDFRMTAPVNSLEPNEFGLYNMHGNVSEWVKDCWKSDYLGGPTDGRAYEVQGCKKRVVRGGSWRDLPSEIRSSYRSSENIGLRVNTIGFRLAHD